MSDRKTGRGSDQFPLRLPDGLRQFLKDAAAENGRSLNAEIISRIEDTMLGTGGSTIAEIAQFAWNVIEKLEPPASHDQVQELEILYMSILEREAEDKAKFLKLARKIIDEREDDIHPDDILPMSKILEAAQKRKS
jgi:hypothetical protein